MSKVCPLVVCGTLLLTTRVVKAVSVATSNVTLSGAPPVATPLSTSSFTGCVLYTTCAPFAGETGLAEATEALGFVGELHAAVQTNSEAPPASAVIIRAACMEFLDRKRPCVSEKRSRL